MNYFKQLSLLLIIMLLFVFYSCASDPLIKKYSEEQIMKSNYYFMKGVEFHKKKEIENAINEYMISLKIVPDNPLTNYNLGLIYMEKAEYGKALIHFFKTEEIEKKNSELYTNIALCYLGLRNFKESISYMQKACKLPLKSGEKNKLACEIQMNMHVAFLRTNDISVLNKIRLNRSIPTSENYRIIVNKEAVYLKIRKQSFSLPFKSEDIMFKSIGNPDKTTVINNTKYYYWDDLALLIIMMKEPQYIFFLNKENFIYDIFTGKSNSIFKGDISLDKFIFSKSTHVTVLEKADKNIKMINKPGLNYKFVKVNKKLIIMISPDMEGYIDELTFMF